MNLLGKAGYEEITEEEHDLLSLERQVGEGASLAFLWTTFEDEIVPCLHSTFLAVAYVKCKIPCELYMYSHGCHSLGLADH